VILLGTQLPTGGVDDKQVICNNLQNHFWSHLRLICAARVRRSSFCNVDHLIKLFSWSTEKAKTFQLINAAWSLWTNSTSVSESLTNVVYKQIFYKKMVFMQRSWTIGVGSSILRFSGPSSEKSLHGEKTQVRICWIFRSHRGQGWLDTHILLGLFYHIGH